MKNVINNSRTALNMLYVINNFEINQFSTETRPTTTTITHRDFIFIPDNSPTWNVPFGIVILVAITIMLYLLQRSKGS